MNTIVMEHIKSILFHKSEPANKQHTTELGSQFKPNYKILEWNGHGVYLDGRRHPEDIHSRQNIISAELSNDLVIRR